MFLRGGHAVNQFKLAEGVSVSNMDGIHECYEILDKESFFSFAINISIEKLEKLLREFCTQLTEPCFFILEIPTNEKNEQELRKNETDPFHADVYYLDGVTTEDLNFIIDTYGDLLINDGMVRFGFASHISNDEIFVGKYKVTYIFTQNRALYQSMLHKFDIPFEKSIKTVQSNFTYEQPGQCRCIKRDGKDIYTLADELKEKGLYFAQRIEE